VALDLFCGAGLFAGVLGEAVGPAGAVIGVESDRGAVRDARHNVRSLPWVRIHHGDVATVLAGETLLAGKTMRTGDGRPGAGIAVLDPPRAGAGRAVIERLLRPPRMGGRLRRVAYVSCDPATLARDIAAFGELGWRLDGLRAFDAFPMTHHVECVAALTPG
jgi:tRNA/tmRNA/rRNA uracil-C5-methylase (TrmA/RlmC/RlmD family)